MTRINDLRPVAFKWKQNGAYDWGFIAHEVAQSFPGIVVGEKDGEEMQQVAISAPAVIAALVTVVQDLGRRIGAMNIPPPPPPPAPPPAPEGSLKEIV